ncbi:2-keto-myo-inositol dehydratase [Defluviimonas denitrificans]|jgi:inosose dehydratase|uniref:2-keto-myo-inositol dehydratase n=1 Tax=Albidovulum denitrificans TaxID=404881 RepID=A0A2S8S528_9RHOB|nr:myo-inosose-2 dehydratase [Defluviimonas denitrificans]PQV55893.1 2-keto-myo-inositol dehydratase [Defluviimonas denitrificans]
MIRFGTNPIAWANDDDQSLGAHIPTDQILREAAAIGFDGIENGHRWPDDPEALRQLLGGHGLAFISGWYSLNLLTQPVAAEKAAIQRHLDKLKHNGSAVCIVCETSNSIQGRDVALSQSPVLTAAAMRDFGAKVEELANFTAAQGITLVYHHHMGTVVETPEEIDAFMAATGPAMKLLFDAGHCYFGGHGADPAPVLRKYAGRVAHFHAKNVRPEVMAKVRDTGMSFMDGVRAGVFTVPGDPEGGVDFAPLLRILKDSGYGGWIVIEAEQDPEVRDPVHYQSLGLRTLKTLAAEAGLV